MKILVTGAGSLLGQGIIRTLKKIDINFHLIAVDINPYSAGLYWVNEKFIIPNAESPSYLQSCLLYTSPSPRDRTRSRMPSSA